MKKEIGKEGEREREMNRKNKFKWHSLICSFESMQLKLCDTLDLKFRTGSHFFFWLC